MYTCVKQLWESLEGDGSFDPVWCTGMAVAMKLITKTVKINEKQLQSGDNEVTDEIGEIKYI